MFINSTYHKVWASATKPKGFVTKKIEYPSLIKFYPNQKLSFKFKKNDLEKNNIFLFCSEKGGRSCFEFCDIIGAEQDLIEFDNRTKNQMDDVFIPMKMKHEFDGRILRFNIGSTAKTIKLKSRLEKIK